MWGGAWWECVIVAIDGEGAVRVRSLPVSNRLAGLLHALQPLAHHAYSASLYCGI